MATLAASTQYINNILQALTISFTYPFKFIFKLLCVQEGSTDLVTFTAKLTVCDRTAKWFFNDQVIKNSHLEHVHNSTWGSELR